MDRETLKALQAPLKQKYQSDPASGLAELAVSGVVDFDRPGCRVELLAHDGRHLLSGLHPMAGGDGSQACSGDLLLQALATCAGTTLSAVATAMGLPVSAACVHAAGTMDFRGTLGVDRSVPVGFTALRLSFEIETTADQTAIEKLIQLTERYCVVYQTLAAGVSVSCDWRLAELRQ